MELSGDQLICNSSTASSRTKTKELDDISEEDKEKLRRQNERLVSSFQARNLEQYAQKYWDQFYKRNTTKFFKDRHWTTREFYELVRCCQENSDNKIKILELGCGVGNLIFPLIKEEINIEIFACDFSPRAINFVRENPLFNPEKINVFQADITQDDLLDKTGVHVDLITSVFIFSALHPDSFVKTVKNIYKVLNPGGIVFFRDYGLHDMTQIRFKPGHKISENLYMRQDGTRTYFFSTEILKDIFINEGFEDISCCYIKSRTVNVKENVNVPRTFVQAKFRKCPIP